MSHRAAVSLIPLLAVASFLASGCSSSGTGLANMPEPDLIIAQASSVANTARHEMGGLVVELLVQITNNATQAITLKRVETQSIGLGAYSVSERSAEANSHPFDLRIPPSGTRTVSLWMSARANDTVNGLNGPVTLRMIANFDSAAGAFRSIVIRQVHDFPAPE